jgi:hypothetical protein
MNKIRGNTIRSIVKDKISGYQVSKESIQYLETEFNKILNKILEESLEMFKQENITRKKYQLKQSRRLDIEIFRKVFKQINDIICCKGKEGLFNNDTSLSLEAVEVA